MIEGVINYTPLEWLLSAGEPCLQEHHTSSRWPCFSRGIGLDDPQRSLPTTTIPRFWALTLTSGAWAWVPCLWAALQANSETSGTDVSAAWVPDVTAAGQLHLQRWPTCVAEGVEETDPMVRLFWVGFTSPILSTEFLVTLAELINSLRSLER